MLLQSGVISCRDSGLLRFFPGLRFEFSQKVVHWSHTGMRIAVPHKHYPGFLNTGHGDKRTMIVSVSLIDFR